MEPILGIQIARLGSGADSALEHCRVCTWMVCCRARKKPDQPSSWNWAGNLRLSYFPGALGLVRAQGGEQETTSSCPLEAGGK